MFCKYLWLTEHFVRVYNYALQLVAVCSYLKYLVVATVLFSTYYRQYVCDEVNGTYITALHGYSAVQC